MLHYMSIEEIIYLELKRGLNNMGFGFLTGGKIEFNTSCEDDFKKEMRANIPGIKPEDVVFRQLEATPYDNIFEIEISCHTRLSESDSINYSTTMKIDKREYYGFDYSVSNGLLYVTLYKEKKKDVQYFGFGFKFETKYPKQPQYYI